MKTLALLLPTTLILAFAGCATLPPDQVVRARTTATEVDSTEAWKELDTDSDGSLTREELAHERAMGLLQDFPFADSDGDDRVTREEWNAWWPTMTWHHIREGDREPSIGM